MNTFCVNFWTCQREKETGSSGKSSSRARRVWVVMRRVREVTVMPTEAGILRNRLVRESYAEQYTVLVVQTGEPGGQDAHHTCMRALVRSLGPMQFQQVGS